MMNGVFENINMFTPIETAAKVTFDDITAVLADFDVENSCLSIISNE
jgi:hypothetical protein